MLVESHLQSNLDNISKWCTYNDMALHPQKTKCMIIGSKQKLRGDKQLTLKVNENILENVRFQKVLGVYIDCNISWHTHIDCLQKSEQLNIIAKAYFILLNR